jgi:hypothetical protein
VTRPSELHRQFRDRRSHLLGLVERVTALLTELDAAQTGAALLMSPGGASIAERVSGGDTHSDPVLAEFFAREFAAKVLANVDDELATIYAGAYGARRELERLSPIGRMGETAEKPERPKVACKACERVIAMTANDRPRGDYCQACYRAWLRVEAAWEGPGGADRAQFERDRAKWSGISEDRTLVRTDGSRVTSMFFQGREYNLTWRQQEELARLGPAVPDDVLARILSGDADG